VLDSDPSSLINLVLNGAEPLVVKGTPDAYRMPQYRVQLIDDEIAQVLTFVRSAWGNARRLWISPRRRFDQGIEIRHQCRIPRFREGRLLTIAGLRPAPARRTAPRVLGRCGRYEIAGTPTGPCRGVERASHAVFVWNERAGRAICSRRERRHWFAVLPTSHQFLDALSASRAKVQPQALRGLAAAALLGQLLRR
jgi:hypothetical protein